MRFPRWSILCCAVLSFHVAGCKKDATAHDAPPFAGAPTPTGPWQLQGRVTRSADSSWKLAWAGSAVKARFNGTAVDFDLANQAEGQQARYGLTIDGQDATILQLSTSLTHYTFDGLKAGAHTVTLRKLNEAGFAEGKFYGFTLAPDAQFLPLAASSGRRIEFIGDGRVNGFGLESEDAGCHSGASNENVEMAYGATAARALHADYRVIAATDRGVARNRDGSEAPVIADLWQRDVLTNWQPQVVVLDAGASDFASGRQSAASFTSRYADLLRQVRRAYSSATIVCVVPQTATQQHDMAASWVRDAVQAVGDDRVHVVDFVESQGATGCNGLPSAAGHKQMAQQLSAVVGQWTGW